MSAESSHVHDLQLHVDSPAWCAINELALEGRVTADRLLDIVDALQCKVVTYYGVSGPYLDRWDLGDKTDKGHRYLHRFRRNDEDHVLHDHPWWFSSTILLGGYVEERFVNGSMVRRRHVQGDGVGVPLGLYHRVDELVGNESWSLVETGPKALSWHFWDPSTNAKWPWRKYLRKKGLLVDEDPQAAETQ